MSKKGRRANEQIQKGIKIRPFFQTQPLWFLKVSTEVLQSWFFIVLPQTIASILIRLGIVGEVVPFKSSYNASPGTSPDDGWLYCTSSAR